MQGEAETNSGSIVTLIAAQPGSLPDDLVKSAQRATDGGAVRVLAAGEAVEWSSPLSPETLRPLLPLPALEEARIDHLAQSAALPRRKRLLAADMDSTIVEGETLDRIAALHGCGTEVTALSEASVEGQINFASSLRRRILLLRGMAVDTIGDILRTITLNEGAALLVRTMQAHGAYTVLISGGLTLCTSQAASIAGFDAHHGNKALIENGCLTGLLREPVLDPASKKQIMLDHATALGLTAADCLAIGDGANDLPMLRAAGLGIAFHARPAVAQAIPNRITHGNLRAALFAQGYAL
ncbi:Phosphoserine phosphatase [Granulibacter bethesdensis]|uniref:Phosphoserine phosphatase n=1 Tax=Granulibacter bethesdensis TaxID=364410 RepID=A0AAC9P983_9PROT|nr:phosphoserine phosphatase SerB [Granulibacter bethesdensis]APH54784.1 Phosphoserine phosphatase [Granulibacter bethesdensis]APH62370.1 Phosphoserine phosphatase [Granulibacter bethesdensis]